MGKEEEIKHEHVGSHSLIRQVCFALIVAAASLNYGLLIGWPSNLSKITEGNYTPVIPSDYGDEKIELNDEDVAWLASMTGLVYVIACFITGPLDEVIGPKRLLSLILIPLPGCWLLQAFAPYVSLLYLGRALTALCGAMIATLLPPLLAELCDTKHRGMVVSFSEIMLDTGLLGSYVLAKYLPWRIATAVSSLPFFILAVLTPLVPESPYWLVEKNKVKEAEASLRRLRGPKSTLNDELNAITSTTIQRNPSLYDQITKLKRARYAQPVLLVTVIFMLREIGGKTVIFTYAVLMFTRTGTGLDAFTCSILIGIVRLVFTIIESTYVLEHIGRRRTLQYTSLVCGISSALAGAFLIGDFSGSSFVPLLAVLLYVAAYGLGLGPVPWVLIGELLPTPVRVIGASVVTSCGHLMLFVMNFVFPYVISSIGLGWTLIVFALGNLLITAIVWAHLPETTNKTLQELETVFCPEHNEASCRDCPAEQTPTPRVRNPTSTKDDAWTDMQIKNGNVIAFYYNNGFEKKEDS